MIKPASAVANDEAWKAFNKQYAPDQKTPTSWINFLNGWLAKASHMQERRRRGV